jgi:hypothetical protein
MLQGVAPCRPVDAGRFCDAATATKESLMSPTDARRSTDAASLGHPIRQTPGGGNTSVLDNVRIEGALTKDPHPPRPLTPVPVDRTRNAGPHSYSDPSMYLG